MELIISDFTKPELDKFREQCNFTKDERFLFELRAENIPLENAAELMNISLSTVKRMSRKLNIKINKIM